MKKMIGFIGLGIIGGVAIGIFLNKKKKEDTNGISAENIVPENSTVLYPMIEVKDNEDSVKSFVVDAIAARHAEAAEMIKNSVEEIFKNDDTNKINSDKLDKISEELDNLLSEG